TDGILPFLVRVGINAPDKDKRWYVFDGPVDAVWIENMNTVLDNNKKLCLSSGEIIKLRDTMTMMFEVWDGLDYIWEPGVLGLNPFISCWLKRVPQEILTSVDSALLMSFLRLMDFRLGPLSGRDNKPPPPAQFQALIPNLLVPWVVFNTIWSIGATCDNNGRILFDRFIRDRMLEGGHEPQFPEDGLCYDFNLHDGGFTDVTSDGEPAPPTWRGWMDNIADYKITGDMKYSGKFSQLGASCKRSVRYALEAPGSTTDVQSALRLWYDECCRVFQDRLVNDEDRVWFETLLKNQISSFYQLDPDETLGKQPILFGDFLDPQEYNQQSTKPMKLMLFLDAISHVCRISRIIRQPMGNALLLGMGGSGRQSLTRLASFMAEFACFQIELTKAYGAYDWREDVKKLMLNAGLQRRETVFLFSDTQIKSESFLEDLNNVLNSGDVPNIYQPDEMDKIYQGMKGTVQELGLPATKSILFSVYQKQVRSNLHTVITMRARLRQFPALVNCCTIDWFCPWPDSALQFLLGLSKLQITSEEVKVLQEQLKEMKPALQVAAKDADEMIQIIAADTIVAEETKEIVEREEQEATKKAEATQLIAEDAQQDLDEAMPALLAAEQSLKSLNKNDIIEVRSMKRPPAGVVYVIESICIVKNIKPNKIPGMRPGEKLLDYWDPGRNMLSDPGQFLASLMNFDKDSITDEMIEKLKKYVEDPDFTPQKIAKISKACTSLCMWVHAMFKYYFVNLGVAPKKAALKQANEELAETEKALAAARAKMQEVLDRLSKLQTQLNAKIAFKQEKEIWIETIENIEANVINVTGDILISSGCVAYMTPFTDQYRRNLFTQWIRLIEEREIPFSKNANPVSILGDPVEIRLWQLDGLPRDYLSTENAVLVSCSRRWPLFVDPQGQANKWVKNMGKTQGLSICKLSDKDLMRTMESAVRFGKPVLIENVGVDLDPALDPILMRQIYNQGGTMVIKLGDVVVPYDANFRLFITTKLPNPHYTPEVSIKVLLVNFTRAARSASGSSGDARASRLGRVKESNCSRSGADEARVEKHPGSHPDEVEGSPLDDLDFIITLEASKVKSEDIKNKVETAEITQIDIDNTRALYIPVANRAQILFFCLADLSNVDPMYQYSLEWFINIFISTMAKTEKSDDIAERVVTINEYFTFNLFSNVCRSLFEKHKLHFAFLMCIRILMEDGQINALEWQHFLAGGSPLRDLANPAPNWLSSKAWNEILALEALPNFQKFVGSFSRNLLYYKEIFDSAEPHREALPEPFNSTMDDFQKMIVLKSLRPDKVTNAMQDYLSQKLGQQFIEPQSSDLSAMFKESGPAVPLIFVLSTGTDPAADLYKFADRMKMGKRMFSISLGQGQGPRAERMIKEAVEAGSWVFFQLPATSMFLDYMDYIKTFPINDDPVLFGMHPNADITYPVLYEESLNTVLIQEGIRYNKLLVVIKSSLLDLLKAVKGLVVMSETLEKMSLSLYTNLVPQLWANKAYPSLKPLERPKDGCCIWGLFLEGARWNSGKKILDESIPKELYTEMPVIWLVPEENHLRPPGVYECPVYKTLTRAGTLSTTVHSTNYVLAIEVPCEKPEPHWIKNGVALICALDY
ncbi:hypothetical protein YQE_03893, partial [Dendroctonus ponderosae]